MLNLNFVTSKGTSLRKTAS